MTSEVKIVEPKTTLFENNLQYLTAEENIKKSNRYETYQHN